MEHDKLKNIVEGALLAAGRPLRITDIETLFAEGERPERAQLRDVLTELQSDYEGRAVELREVAGGFRVQVRQENSPWVSRLWEERPTRYSRALLETLALIAYRQPITRGEIEDVRGVSVSTNIVRTLEERGWIKVVGHRDVPGRPAMFGTTREFLDYFGLKSLDELPTLAEIRDIDSINVELQFDEVDRPPQVEEGDQQVDDPEAPESDYFEEAQEGAFEAADGEDGEEEAATREAADDAQTPEQERPEREAGPEEDRRERGETPQAEEGAGTEDPAPAEEERGRGG
jgi:segregation and condensation protein B